MKRQLNEDQQRLVEENMAFARQIASSYANCGVELEDLQQECYLGMCEAALRFDNEKGVKFITYARYWCMRFALMAIEAYGKPMHLSRKAREEAQFLRIDEGFDDEEDSNDELLYMIYLQREWERDVDRECEERFANAFLLLTPQEQHTISCLYGLERGEELSTKKTAWRLNVNTGRVSQLKDHAIRKLERHMTA